MRCPVVGKVLWPEILSTGTSKLATVLRWIPKTAKNSFQKVCLSADSPRVPAQSLANLMALWRISIQLSGMGWRIGGREKIGQRV